MINQVLRACKDQVTELLLSMGRKVGPHVDAELDTGTGFILTTDKLSIQVECDKHGEGYAHLILVVMNDDLMPMYKQEWDQYKDHKGLHHLSRLQLFLKGD